MFEDFKKVISEELDSYNELGCCKAARELAESSKQEFNYKKFPHYFTGDLEADLVMINLNPKDGKGGYEKFSNWEEYSEFYSSFGRRKHIEEEGFKSRFDENQLCFYKGFGGIEFLDDNDGKNKEAFKQNLARVIDSKLQLELIPYASNNFKWEGLSKEHLDRQIERLLDIITAKERKYILFCGSQFVKLLEPYRIDKNRSSNIYETRLIKSTGEPVKGNYSFHNITLKYKDTILEAGIAQSYASQALHGYLKKDYGAFCRECWNKEHNNK